MSYFKKFPAYLTRTVSNQQIIIEDFFKRVAITNRANNLTSLLLPYLVLDGETPEGVSNKFYGTPYYHWVILLINEITNPRTEWALESRYVLPHIFEKYDFEIEVPDISEYTIDDVIETQEEGGKFVVTNKSATTIFMRSTVGYTTIALTSKLTNITTSTTDLEVLRVTDPTESVQYYVDVTSGLVVDYSANNPDIVPVTNLQVEEKLNDDKRRIRILDPAFLQLFVRNFENEINE
jgi:hypothetical protein